MITFEIETRSNGHRLQALKNGTVVKSVLYSEVLKTAEGFDNELTESIALDAHLALLLGDSYEWSGGEVITKAMAGEINKYALNLGLVKNN